MKVACYLRVSTGQQDVSNQLPAIKAWCESRGYELVQVYAENESAWRGGHQRELARLLSDLRSGKRKYDYLIVWGLDRLCRQGIGAILQLISSIERYGCHVVSVQESWTAVEGPMRELFIAIVGWAARFESDRRSERVKAGLARAIRQGKRLGRPVGSKDGKLRRKAGYLNRWMINKGSVKNEAVTTLPLTVVNKG